MSGDFTSGPHFQALMAARKSVHLTSIVSFPMVGFYSKRKISALCLHRNSKGVPETYSATRPPRVNKICVDCPSTELTYHFKNSSCPQ